MNNQYIAEKVPAKHEAESKRLTSILQEKLDIERSANLTSEIHKITQKRKLKGDKLVFKNDSEFREAGLEILKKYDATESEKTWFLTIVAKPFTKW